MCTDILSHRNSVELDAAGRTAVMKNRASGTAIHLLQTSVLVLFCMLMCGSAFAQDIQLDTKTETDHSYVTDDKGKPGKKITETLKHFTFFEPEKKTLLSTTTTITIYDPEGRFRERRSTEINAISGKVDYEEVMLFDCNGKTYYKRFIRNASQDTSKFVEERYEDGDMISGIRRGVRTGSYDLGKKYSEKYNPKTKKWEEEALNTTPGPKEVNFEPDKSTCPFVSSYMANEIGISFTLIREDSQPDPFNTLGGSFSYTRFLSEVFGLTGDIDATFKSQTGQDLSKYTFLAGVTVLPFPNNRNTDNLSIFAHDLAGESSLINKYGSSKFTDHAFAFDVGAGLMVNLNKNFGISFNADYMHTNFGNEPQNDFKVSVGAALKIGEITSPRKIRWAPEKKFN